MKLLVFADLHFHLKNYDTSSRGLTLIDNHAVENGVEEILCLGDFFHEKPVIRSEVLRFCFNLFKNSKNRWVLLVGNHDLENTYGESNHNSLEIFGELPNVTVVSQMVECNDDIWLVPFYRDCEQLKKDMDRIPDDSVVMMHQGIEGAAYSSGVAHVAEIKIKDLKRFKKVYSGHIHNPQAIKNLEYVGSPFTQSFGESGEDKAIHIFDVQQREMVKKINLEELPRHVQLEYDIKSEKDFKNLMKYGRSQDDIRAIFTGKKEVLSKLDKSVFEGFPNLSIQKREVEEVKKILIEEHLTYEKMVEKYLSTIQTELDKKVIMGMSNRILGECQDAYL